MASDISRTRLVTMSDGCQVKTAVISSENELTLHLPDFISGAHKSGLFIGFDTEWMFRNETFPDSPSRTKIALLKLCNNSGFCLLIELHRFESMPRALVEFLAVRDVAFLGVNISEELKKLKEDYGLEIKTKVDLSLIASGKLGRYLLGDYCRSQRVPLEGLDCMWQYTRGSEPKGVDEEQMFWLVDNPWDDFGEDSKDKQLEYAVFSAYAAVKIANNFYGHGSARKNRIW